MWVRERKITFNEQIGGQLARHMNAAILELVKEDVSAIQKPSYLAHWRNNSHFFEKKQ